MNAWDTVITCGEINIQIQIKRKDKIFLIVFVPNVNILQKRLKI